jgi:hypothetical protein
MQLYGDWEVGMSEIFYTKTWFNIVEDEEIRFYYENKGVSTNFIPVEAGCYRDIYSILNKINICLDELVAEFASRPGEPDPIIPTVRFNPKIKRVEMISGKMNGRRIIPLLSKSLKAILGFPIHVDDNFIKNPNTSEFQEGEEIKVCWTADKEVDISVTINAFYVYCDIIKSSVVGDTYSKFLRVVNIKRSDFGGSSDKNYNQPLYYQLEKKEFQTIEIDIKDDSGEQLKFDGGRVIIVLHFRKKDG